MRTALIASSALGMAIVGVSASGFMTPSADLSELTSQNIGETRLSDLGQVEIGTLSSGVETSAIVNASAGPSEATIKPVSAQASSIASGQTGDLAQSYQIAMALWRNSDPAVHRKGSCSGCHGADFLDLAVIGSTQTDIVRRALLDGATNAQADALATSVQYLRTRSALPARNARTYRPFQPGGEVLLPSISDPAHIQSIKRDIEFGNRIATLVPTLASGRVGSLSQAMRARNEMLDIAYGSNLTGANPGKINLRRLQTGITYPLWSSDAAHGASEATLNDWLADVARDAPADKRASWHAAQDAYLAAPNRVTFWAMYKAAQDLTVSQPAGPCQQSSTNPSLACGGGVEFGKNKFFSALIGQHLMRIEAGLAPNDFAEGPLAFAYLDTNPDLAFMRTRKDPEFLPANMWEVGDRSRVMLTSTKAAGSLRDELARLGFPDFVVESVDATAAAGTEQHRVRLPWFWLGFTFDPSFARMHASNSTKVGEYLVATLLEENMHMHNTFQAHMRLVAKGSLQQANVRGVTRPSGVVPTTTTFDMNYSYFIGYGRSVIRWQEDAKAGRTIPAGLKAEQTAMYHRFTANGFRMSLYLYLDALSKDAEPKVYSLDAIKQHFDTYQPEHKVADTALLNRVREAMGDAGRY